MLSRSLNDFSNEGLRSPERCNSLEKYVCMMSFSEEPQLRVVDGVQVIGAPKKVGPFYQYPVFAAQLHDGTTFEFCTDKIYRVKTVGKIGYAKLKMIFVNEKTSQCFSRFVLFHLPENTKRGTQVWKHGKDELLQFSRNITIRCLGVLAWAILERDTQSNGTRSFSNDEMEVYRYRNLSLVRLKHDPKTEYSEQYSVFAGNSKLSKKLGIDVIKLEFMPGNTSVQHKKISSSCRSDTRKVPYKQNLVSNEEHISDKKISEAKRILSNGNKASFNKAMTCMESTKGTVAKSHCCKESSDDAMTGKVTQGSALFRSCKSSKSLNTPSRTRRTEKRQDILEQKQEGTSSSASSSTSSSSLTTSTNIELECKIKILSYEDYLTFMKCQMGLKGGLVIEREEAFAKEVIASNGNSYRIYFVRTSFTDKDLLRSPLFEKTIGKKARLGKKRKVKEDVTEVKNHESVLSDVEATEFKEDEWKEVSEYLYFDRIGHKRNSDSGSVQGKKSVMKVKRQLQHVSH